MIRQYKVGDKVKIKSLKWYKENRNIKDNSDLWRGVTITDGMSEYCGKIFTIIEVDNTFTEKEIMIEGSVYRLNCGDWCWQAFMFEEQEQLEFDFNA